MSDVPLLLFQVSLTGLSNPEGAVTLACRLKNFSSFFLLKLPQTLQSPLPSLSVHGFSLYSKNPLTGVAILLGAFSSATAAPSKVHLIP